jgi:hypothetical protein
VGVTPTPYQQAVLSVPEAVNLALAGGRGGGKSYGALLVVLRHVEKHGARARPLLIRETHKALLEMEDTLAELLHAAYDGVRHNRGEHVFRLPNGAVVELGQLSEPGDYRKYQGRSFTLLVVEEFGAMKDARRVQLLRSNLRAPEGIPLRTIITANPGGALHTYCHQQYMQEQAWHPYSLDGETWVTCPSTFLDNPHLNHADYERKLRAACAGDEALLKAWLSGDWNIARGAFFGDLVSADVHMLADDWIARKPRGWRSFVAMDFGLAAPSVAYFCVMPSEHAGRVAARSLVLLDELAVADPSDLNRGLQWPPGKLAEFITARCDALGVAKSGVCDDYRGLDDTLIGEFRRFGLHFQRPAKSRLSGWARMRQLLQASRDASGQPGLYVARRCRYWWATVPFLPRDELRPEDVDTTAPDHGADACRYAVLHSQVREVTSVPYFVY